jgi:hypothetical protein
MVTRRVRTMRAAKKKREKEKEKEKEKRTCL